MTRSEMQASNSEKSARSAGAFQQFGIARKTASGTTLTSGKSSPATMVARPKDLAGDQAVAAGPTHDQIAERAKAIWQTGGCKPGTDVENWLEAEKQLRAQMRRQ